MVTMMVIPLPWWSLDLLITFNLSFSLVVVLVTMYTKNALDFSMFPSLLLLTTLFRLSLNVSSSRLILLNGFAGQVIQAFGQFVVGGNPVVGFIIFLILVVIQFVVITRGAERVAEVAARFTLDAMPGKQMSIDADLNAGLITDKEARERRRTIEREADFYGAMDGASKFVRGDAIAGIIIVAVNIIGGFVVGMWQRGMTWQDALNTYTLLTVGDGLVSQIPALLLSTATGIIVTRAASEDNLGVDLVKQILVQPRIMGITAGGLFALSLVPGLPFWTFAVLAGVFGFSAYTMNKSNKHREVSLAQVAKEEEKEAARKPENVLGLLQLDTLELDLGYGLLALADARGGGDLLDRVAMVRRQVAVELGLVVPPIRVRDDLVLKPNQYKIKLKGVEVATGELVPGQFMAIDPGTVTEPVPGLPAKDPVFGLPAIWIIPADRGRAEARGYMVVDPPSVVMTNLSEIIRAHAPELLGRQEVQSLLDNLKKDKPVLVEETLGNLSLGEVQKVLQNLLREKVSIRDMESILEALADRARSTKESEPLTEAARQALGRQLANQYGFDRKKTPVLTLAPDAERALAAAVERREGGSGVNLPPADGEKLLRSLATEVGKLQRLGAEPIILVAASVRWYLRLLTERSFPKLAVLSYNELPREAEVEAVGMVSIG